MRNAILPLKQDTIDRIAAGEVVERPASVMKELVENAIDAEASAISVEIEGGGIDLLRITDNGIGIPYDEVRTAFLRHTTSKIRTAEDLMTVQSLGFRGEALSSISAVARVELFTKTADEMVGTHYQIEGSKEIALEEIGTPNGTTFLIRSLFYNTPARRKFLKSPMTEGNYIRDILEKLALSHPEISFKFRQNRQDKFQTPGNGSLKDTIYALYGKDVATHLIPVSFVQGDLQLKGFIGESVLNRGNRSMEIFYVNGRYVKSSVLSKAVEQGAVGYVMQHQYPLCILFLDYFGQEVDVNVHPTKQDVRFTDEPYTFEKVSQAIHEAFAGREDIREQELSKKQEKAFEPVLPEEKSEPMPEPFQADRLMAMKEAIVASIHKDTPYERQYTYRQKDLAVKEDVKDFTETAVDEPDEDEPVAVVEERYGNYEQMGFLSEESKKTHRLIGQVFETYWMIEYGDNLYMVDQHAAHEKVLYERTMKRLRHQEMTTQMVSPPVVVSLSSKEEEALKRHMDVFTSLGYEIENFGGREYALKGVPGNLFSIDPKALFTDIISNADNWANEKTSQLVLEKVASMSCKAAIKGNMKISAQEMEALFDEMMTLDEPYHCPHGRPTIISFSRTDLDKKFKRIVN
jgi:DNA mismatch repair protein MutL